MKFDLLHPRVQLKTIMDRIYSREMTTTSGGNLSLRDENGDVWITPARVDKGNLVPGDMARISLEGKQQEGPHRPSSEFPFHLSVYKVRPDIGAIIHAHPSALVSFSMCGVVPDTRVFPEVWNVCGKVAFAPYALPGSQRLGDRIAAEFARSGDVWCVVLQNHGVVVGGANLEDAFKRFETLEFSARAILHAKRIGNVCVLEDSQLTAVRQTLPVRMDAKVETATSRERELRKEICDFMHRAYAHRLVTSTWGSLSARIDERTFVITPYGVDRHALDLDDLVIVRDGSIAGGGRRPSRAALLHQAIYQTHPEINAVINALPPHSTAFSISDVKLDTRTIPESYLFLKDVPRIPFDMVLNAPGEVGKSIGPGNPVALLDHNGALVAGRSVLDAFDRLEVLEATAEATIHCTALGAIAPMEDEVIRELLEAFGQV